MNSIDNYKTNRQLKPLVSLFALLVISGLMIGASFTIFWNSNSRHIVKSLQQINEQNPSPDNIAAEGINSDGRLTNSELLFIRESLNTNTQDLNPDSDFGGDALDKSKIGF